MAAHSISIRSASPPQSPWLFGGAVDLLLGAGLAYVASIPILLYLASARGVAAWSADLTFLLAFAFSAPHYGATLIRVYEQRSDRRKYAIFAVHATALLALSFAAALKSVLLGSLLLTLYVTWSPWHFAGQNYGIGLMFLRRRNVTIEPAVKRLLYASFVLSTLLAVLAIHRASSVLVFAQSASDQSGTYSVMRLGIPEPVARVVAPLAATAWLATLALAALRLRRSGSWRDLAPAGAVVLTQSLWFTVPALGATTGAYSASSLAFAPIWISTAHAVQYLWVTTFYSQRSSPPVATVPFLTKAILAGAVLTTLPKLLFVPGLLGSRVALAAGVPVLLFSVVNLHHFVLDGAVWKLRDGRVARALLRTDAGASESGAEGAAAARSWLRPLVWCAGALCLLVVPFVALERSVGESPTADLSRVEAATRRLAWLGRDPPDAWLNLANRAEAAGRVHQAIRAHRELMGLLRRTGQLPSLELANHLAQLLLAHRRSDPRSVAEALRLAGWTAKLSPNDVTSLETLADANAAAADLRRRPAPPASGAR